MRPAAVAGLALLIGSIGAAVTHGEHHAMVAALWYATGTALVLLAVGAVLRSSLAVRCGIAVLLAVPAAFVAGRAVVPFDLWKAKRYLASEVTPRLEAARAAGGQYPAQIAVGMHSPPSAPWLVSRFHYSSDGRTYTLWVMDPGVCGRVWSYSSITRRWTQSYDPCWY